MEFENVLKLIKTVSDSSLTSFKYQTDDVTISIKADRDPQVSIRPEPIQEQTGTGTVIAAQEPNTSDEIIEGMVVNSPLVGTYYAAPAEDAESFVKIGDVVKKGQTLAIVEAMKLMNEIESEADGTIAEILAKNGDAVEYGQPLFRIV